MDSFSSINLNNLSIKNNITKVHKNRGNAKENPSHTTLVTQLIHFLRNILHSKTLNFCASLDTSNYHLTINKENIKKKKFTITFLVTIKYNALKIHTIFEIQRHLV